MARTEPYERVMRRVVRTDGGCDEFTGRPNAKGYGRVSVPGTAGRMAHRVVWEHSVGPIPDGLCVLHRCDNPPCVRLGHLFLGTQADNSADMVAKGRQQRMRGERAGKAKLSSEAVRQLRLRYAEGEPVVTIASDLGIAEGTVHNIARGFRRQWDGLVDGAPSVRRPVKRINWALAEQLYRAGDSTVSVAARVGTYPGNVSRAMRGRGVPMRRSAHENPERARELGLLRSAWS